MSVSEIWKPYGVTLHTADITPIKSIAGLTSFSVDDNLTIERENVDGSPYPVITTLSGREEKITGNSMNIDDVLDIIGVGGQCFKGTNAVDGIKFWLAKWNQCDLVPESGSVHRFYGVTFGATSETRGILSLESLTCAHRQNAEAAFNVDLSANSSSTTAMVIGTGQALPGSVGDNLNRFTLGKSTVGGVLITGKTNLSIATNISINRVAADSNPAAEFVHISENKPVITIRGLDPTWAIPQAGIACTHANTIIYLRKRSRATGVDFVDDATAEHIKITAKGRAFLTTPASGQAASPSETVLTIYPEYDPSTLTIPIVALTEQAIT